MASKLSIVIPVFNERSSLATLYGELAGVAHDNGYSLEILFVDDGSSDDSWAEIERLAAQHPDVNGLRFRRNFGKAAALAAGFQAARGDIVFTMDADLQDDPREIPRFLAELDKDLDVISGWKKVRHDPWHKVIPSRIFNALVSRLTRVRLHDHNCGFKCYRREILGEIRLYGDLHRFVPVLAAARGWRVGELIIHHRPRLHGRSKYGVGRMLRGFLDLWTVYFLTGFRQRPQHLLGALGLAFFLLGGGGLTILTAWWAISRFSPNDSWPAIHLHERAVFYYAIMAVLLGAQFMSIGFVAELLTSYYGRDSVPYSISQRTEAPSNEHLPDGSRLASSTMASPRREPDRNLAGTASSPPDLIPPSDVL